MEYANFNPDRGKLLKQQRQKRGLNQTQIADLLGIKRTTYTGYEKGSGIPKNLWGQVSAELDIPLTTLAAFEIPKDALPDGVEESIAPYLPIPEAKVVVETVDNSGTPNIALVNSRAAAGYMQRYMDREFIGELPTFSLPFPNLRNGTYRAFQITGNNIYPTVKHGDVVIGEYMNPAQWRGLASGRIYILVTQDELVCKRVINRLDKPNPSLRLKSDNLQTGAYEVSPDIVREIWEWKCAITFDGANDAFDIVGWMQQTENQLSDLQQIVHQLSGQLNRLNP